MKLFKNGAFFGILCLFATTSSFAEDKTKQPCFKKQVRTLEDDGKRVRVYIHPTYIEIHAIAVPEGSGLQSTKHQVVRFYPKGWCIPNPLAMINSPGECQIDKSFNIELKDSNSKTLPIELQVLDNVLSMKFKNERKSFKFTGSTQPKIVLSSPDDPIQASVECHTQTTEILEKKQVDPNSRAADG